MMQPPPPQLAAAKEDQEEDKGTTEAGIVRAAVRTLGSIYRAVAFGQLPRRVPVKAVGPLTDKIATAIDTYAALKDAHHQQRQQHQPSSNGGGGGGGGGGGALWRKAQLLGSAAAQATPQLVKSAFLGGVVFELYDATKGRLEGTLHPHPHHHHQSQLMPTFSPHLLLPLTCTAAGAAAGACHGAMYVGWEHAAAVVARLRIRSSSSSSSSSQRAGPPPPLRVNNVWGGTAAAHALAHATLFGAFEVAKEGLLMATGADHGEPLGVFLVGLAGALAGITEETVSHFTASWEQEGVSSLRSVIKRHGLPHPRAVATAALPASIGFLSFEYGRKFGSGGDEEGEEGDDGD